MNNVQKAEGPFQGLQSRDGGNCLKHLAPVREPEVLR